jgi:aspartate carbamoyltransferase catalytic subunit
MQHAISIQQFADKSVLGVLFKRAAELQNMQPEDYPKPLLHKTLATVFYEPSTRTRLSFEAAIQNLGGRLITVENASGHSSAKKGESLEDTIRTINAYADGIILRHPEIGSAGRAAAISDAPVINAGDGASEHPTQALLDAYTIFRAKGGLDGLHVAVVGDLLNSRTERSLIYLLALFDITMYLIAPKSQHLPEKDIKYLKQHKVSFTELESWQEVLPEIDVMYINRIQEERFAKREDFLAVRNSFTLTTKDVRCMKKTAIILNPLPRINEIDPEVDKEPQAHYFQQVKNGLFVRMALLEQMFSGSSVADKMPAAQASNSV